MQGQLARLATGADHKTRTHQDHAGGAALKMFVKLLITGPGPHLNIGVVRSVWEWVGPRLGVKTLPQVPEHDVAIIISSHQALRVKIKTPDIVFNAEKPQAGAILEIESYCQWQANLQIIVTWTFQILTDLSDPLDPVTAIGNLILTQVI